MFCQFLLYSKVTQSHIYTYTFFCSDYLQTHLFLILVLKFSSLQDFGTSGFECFLSYGFLSFIDSFAYGCLSFFKYLGVNPTTRPAPHHPMLGTVLALDESQVDTNYLLPHEAGSPEDRYITNLYLIPILRSSWTAESQPLFIIIIILNLLFLLNSQVVQTRYSRVCPGGSFLT